METAFACLIVLQFLVIALHDLVDIPGWTHASQVKALLGARKVWIVTLINSIFPGLAAAFAVLYWRQNKPAYVENYWIIYCAIALISAIAMWYIPYFLGATDERKRDFASMYAGTRQVLPPRGGNPRPNFLHVCFHVLFVVNFVLVLALQFQRA